MEKFKRVLLALIVATAVTGTTQTIVASTDKKVSSPGTKPNMSVVNTRLGSTKQEDANDPVLPVQGKNYNVKAVTAVKATVPKVAAKSSKPVVSKTNVVKKAATAAKTKTSKTTTKKVAAASATKVKMKVAVSRGKNLVPVSAEKSQAIIDYAKQFMGIKYVFGGATPSGFDCSGFTMYVFNKFGIDLPHSASAQAEMGIAVAKSELMPGDLVFFQTYKPGISHVGIYIGGGKFIEASSSRGIAITDLSSSYYGPRYRGATRIIK